MFVFDLTRLWAGSLCLECLVHVFLFCADIIKNFDFQIVVEPSSALYYDAGWLIKVDSRFLEVQGTL